MKTDSGGQFVSVHSDRVWLNFSAVKSEFSSLRLRRKFVPDPFESGSPVKIREPLRVSVPKCRLSLLAIVVGIMTITVFAARLPAAELATLVTPEQVNESLANSVTYLLSRQHDSGCFADDRDRYRGKREEWKKKVREKRYHPPRHSTALTSLSILSLAALGHQPADPTDEGRAMANAIDYIVDGNIGDDRGYYGSRDHSRMYGHGITSLMLAEMTGMGRDEEQDRKLRERCQQAIDIILQGQQTEKSAEHQGGWRYQPDARDSDLSVTVWQLMALRSAKNGGMEVPSTAIDKAIKYLQICYHSDRHADGTPKESVAGFSYQRGRNPEFATTAAGVLALQVSGAYDYPEVAGACEYLMTENKPDPHKTWFYYGLYYYSQSFAQRGGAQADEARQITESLLMELQKDDGSYQGAGQENSRVYSTAMAVLSLSIQHHFLPIYQR